MGSKASGEPALLLSVSILHALRAAVKAARQEVMHHTQPSNEVGLTTAASLSRAASYCTHCVC